MFYRQIDKAYMILTSNGWTKECLTWPHSLFKCWWCELFHPIFDAFLVIKRENSSTFMLARETQTGSNRECQSNVAWSLLHHCLTLKFSTPTSKWFLTSSTVFLPVQKAKEVERQNQNYKRNAQFFAKITTFFEVIHVLSKSTKITLSKKFVLIF